MNDDELRRSSITFFEPSPVNLSSGQLDDRDRADLGGGAGRSTQDYYEPALKKKFLSFCMVNLDKNIYINAMPLHIYYK